MRRLTQEEFVERMKKVHPDFKVIGQYVNSTTLIEIMCSQGHIWTPQPNNALKPERGCLYCSGRVKKTNTQFKKELKEIFPYYEALDEYINAKTHIAIKCDKGHIWKTSPTSLINSKSGCPYCAKNIKLTTQDFINNLKELNINYEVLEEYNGAHKPIKMRCEKGHVWSATPNHIKRGDGCPACNLNKNATKIKKLLDENNIPYDIEYKFIDCKNIKTQRCLPFDFYVNNHYIIEIDGEQHFHINSFFGGKDKLQSQRERDLIKNKYCFEHSIPLIRIPYNCEYAIDDLKLETTRFLLTPENEKEYYSSRSTDLKE